MTHCFFAEYKRMTCPVPQNRPGITKHSQMLETTSKSQSERPNQGQQAAIWLTFSLVLCFGLCLFLFLARRNLKLKNKSRNDLEAGARRKITSILTTNTTSNAALRVPRRGEKHVRFSEVAVVHRELV